MTSKFFIITVIFILLFNIQACYGSSIIEPNFITVNQSINGLVIGGHAGNTYSKDYVLSVQVKISKADLMIKTEYGWKRVSEYSVIVKIFVNGNLEWSGELAAGGSSPTISGNGGHVLIIIKAPFSYENEAVDYSGIITWRLY